ncbi:17658_t:CDS:2 [Gigaspora margarita]|uniref:17658_t:CDS:1 n=1 Tax=Gigaspora margarita TaxID=4874 RepID=A0ABN7USK8_GIGMA|nr:17658_t:CDS:2 [Gigaspora margarita]
MPQAEQIIASFDTILESFTPYKPINIMQPNTLTLRSLKALTDISIET